MLVVESMYLCSVDISGEEFIGKAFQFKKMIATDLEGEIEWVKTFSRQQMKDNNKKWYGLIKITKGDIDLKEVVFHPVQTFSTSLFVYFTF